MTNTNLGAVTATVPTFCCFSLCDNCILKCQMCQKWKEDLNIKQDKGQLTLADWKACALSLKQIVPENFVINFGGGEVTLMPWLFELISYCNGLGFETSVATNGYLIEENMVRKMAESGLDYINISLDSLDGKIHNQLRGIAGVYEKVMNGIEMISKYAKNTKITICSIIMEPSLEGIIDLAQWAQKNEKIAVIYFMAIMQPNNTLLESPWYLNEFRHLWPKEYEKVEKVLDELIRLKTDKGFKISNKIKQLEAFKTYFLDPQKYVKKSSCNIDRAVHISSVGDVFMCYQFNRLGNIKDNELKKIWASAEDSNIRNSIEKCNKNCHFLLNCNFEE